MKTLYGQYSTLSSATELDGISNSPFPSIHQAGDNFTLIGSPVSLISIVDPCGNPGRLILWRVPAVVK